jgi:23S rRNA (uracil1939-C5)-methyltransferase
LIGEEVEFESVQEKSSFVRGQVTQICKPNINRIQPPCQYFGKCGGCSLQHACYDNELEIKKQLLKAQLKKVNFKEEIEVFASPKEFGYRNKIRLFVGRDGLSLKERASSKLVPIKKCLIVKDKINQAMCIFIKSKFIPS